MSYFNEEQQAYMQELSRIPEDQRCFCGWDRFGQCYNCNRDGEFMNAKTLSDRRKLECPDCGNYPYNETLQITHRMGCKRTATEQESQHK
jgi:hypothetical protein